MSLSIPGRGQWTFDTSDVAINFDEHVREQLPWYDLATSAVAHLAAHYVGESGLVYDIGASTGNVARSIADVLDRRAAKLIALEASQAMCAMYSAPGTVHNRSAFGFQFEPFDVAIALLSLLFMRVDERASVLNSLRQSAKPGGAILIVDKCTSTSGYIATAMWRLALATKLASGASDADVLRKELSLIGVQRPLGARELGPDAVEFFRFGEFAGWIIET